jgi:hypothetical protein
MRKHHAHFLAGGLAILLLAGEASAAFLITGLVNGSNPVPIPGNQPWPGQLGDDFVTTAPLVITSIAVFDDNGDGTSVPLTWQLFDVVSGALIHQEVVPATGPRVPGTTVLDNYVIQPIVPLLLTPSTAYSVVAFGFDALNLNFNTNLDPLNTDVVFNTIGLTAAGGRYSNGPSLLLPSVDAGNAVSNNPYNFGAGAFEYTAIPEAGGFFTFGLCCVMGLAVTWLQSRRGKIEL